MAKAKSKVSEGNPNPDGKHYEEWECKIVGGKEEKLKMLRACVKITEEEAAVLNNGVLKGDNNYGKMYFLPE